MYYYEITIYYAGTTEPYPTFKIDENEIHSFLRFITEVVSDLASIVVHKHFAPVDHGGV